MQFVDLQNEVKDLLNFTSGTADQDFSEQQIKTAINKRYGTETLLAQQHGKRTWFHKVQSFTWTSGSETLALPPSLSQANVISFTDVTASDPGAPLPSHVFWLDNRTLQWGSSSPGSDRTIRATYFARPIDMVNNNDEPDLIPPEHRMVLVWSAAIYLRQKADEFAPGSWLEELNNARFSFWKALSRSRPHMGGSVGSLYDIEVSGAQAAQDGSSINQDNN